jgi:hypothetical protein
VVALGELAVDRGLQLEDGAEHPTLQASAGEGREERLHGVEPQAGGLNATPDTPVARDENYATCRPKRLA